MGKPTELLVRREYNDQVWFETRPITETEKVLTNVCQTQTTFKELHVGHSGAIPTKEEL